MREDLPGGNAFLGAVCDYLIIRDAPAPSDAIFVLAGRPERKVYGLRLFEEGLAPRLILSVGRFEVRKMAQLGFQDLNLRELAAQLPPARRHFFIDLSLGVRRVFPAAIERTGTRGELAALAVSLSKDTVRSLTLVSTSIHLRRIRLCCRKIETFRQVKIGYGPVPEDLSSFRCRGWWKRPDHWSYLIAEYSKLVAYSLLFGSGKRRRDSK
jgi:hypothetical protein